MIRYPVLVVVIPSPDSGRPKFLTKSKILCGWWRTMLSLLKII
jgi:hypothetical protein